MTKDEIVESRRICEAATKGPWRRVDPEYGESAIKDDEDYLVFNNYKNWPFIAHARNALPAALDEIERLNKESQVWEWGSIQYQTDIRAVKLALKDAEAERDRYKAQAGAARERLAWIGTYAHLHTPKEVEETAADAIDDIFERKEGDGREDG